MSYTACYPSSIPDVTHIYQRDVDINYILPSDFDGLREELHAVMGVLGINPQGSFSSVASRLDSGSGGGGFVNRGAVSDPDFSPDAFVCDGNMHTVDLSAIVPSGAKLVYLRLVWESEYSYDTIFLSADGDFSDLSAIKLVAGSASSFSYPAIIVPCSVDRKISFVGSASAQSIDAVVIGWWL